MSSGVHSGTSDIQTNGSSLFLAKKTSPKNFKNQPKVALPASIKINILI